MDLFNLDTVIIWGYPLQFWVALAIIALLVLLKKNGAPKNSQEDMYYAIEAENGNALEIDDTLNRLLYEAELMVEAGVTE